MDSESGNAPAPNQRSRPTFLKMLLLLHFIVFTLISSCVLIGYAIDYHLHTPLIIGLTQLLFAVPGYYGVHHADTGIIYTFAFLAVLLGLMELGWAGFILITKGQVFTTVWLLTLTVIQFSFAFIAMRMPYTTVGSKLAVLWPFKRRSGRVSPMASEATVHPKPDLIAEKTADITSSRITTVPSQIPANIS
ncbi:hypothetical protein AAVH_35308, partial [Aphelenchoides avenae]